MIEAIQAWAARYAVDRRYSPVGQGFHWTMTALILFQLFWGWHMSRVPAGRDKLEAVRIHAEIGILSFVHAILRAFVRLHVPGLVNDRSCAGRFGAHVFRTLKYLM